MRILPSDDPRPLNLLAVGPNGLVAAASNTFGANGSVEVWDATRDKSASVYSGGREKLSIALAPDGAHLLVSEPEDGVTIVELATGRGTMALKSYLPRTEFALSADGNQLVVTSSDPEYGAVQCWELPDFRFRQLWSERPYPQRGLSAPAISSDQARVALYATGSVGRASAEIQILHARTGTRLLTIPFDAASPVRQLAFTSDGAQLLVRTDSNNVQLLDAATGTLRGELTHRGRSYVSGIAVHPRGPVVCARTNGTVTFWAVETREPIRTLDWKAGRLVSIAFAPDGSLAAAGTEDGKIVVWDID